MKALIISDLHLDHYIDGVLGYGRQEQGKVIKNLCPSFEKNVDLVIVAGDIAAYKDLRFSIESVCKYFYPVKILYVPGNHDYYGVFKKGDVGILLRKLEKSINNFSFLDNKKIVLFGEEFIGSTLWFRDDPLNQLYEKSLNDFFYIPRYSKWVYAAQKKAEEFLNKNITKNSIVITHHIPCKLSIPEEYEKSTLNRFFYCGLEELILEKRPRLWIHGHTHSFSDYLFGGTRIICNPYGYPREQSIEHKNLIVEI